MAAISKSFVTADLLEYYQPQQKKKHNEILHKSGILGMLHYTVIHCQIFQVAIQF
jgi:hypothetical protein